MPAAGRDEVRGQNGHRNIQAEPRNVGPMSEGIFTQIVEEMTKTQQLNNEQNEEKEH